MRIYYTTQIIKATKEYHSFFPGMSSEDDFQPDEIMHESGDVVNCKAAKLVKEVYGKQAIAHFDHAGMSSPEYRTHVHSVRIDQNCIKYVFVK